MAVTLVQKYNPEWPRCFEEIKAFMGNEIVRACIRIEHVGSTSIPGMTAKPIIDIDLVIEPQDFETIKQLLAKRGYFHQGDLGIKDRDAFDLDPEVKASLPSHHPYVCPKDSEELKRHLAFRDFLRHNKDYVRRLSALKWDLAEEFDNDRQAYIERKAAFCSEINEQALKAYHPSQ
ncbi:MAG: GrpB family protein [bacterium]|nr:GrpB family protein [bacterium]